MSRQLRQFKDPIRMIKGRHGYMVYNQHCQWVGKALELYGEYCEHEISIFKQLIKETDVVWEIGANTGSQSTALAAMVPQGKFVGFEPQIELFKIFTTNLTLNNCENAISLNIALGDEDGDITLPAVNYHHPHNFGGVSLIAGLEESNISVEIRKIDSLSWLPSPDFIKIDVEGMESMVLHGGLKTIASKRPIMYIENDRVEKSPELISLLWDLGYNLYWSVSTYYNENNYFKNQNNIYSNIVSCNMICMPGEKILNIDGLTKIVNKNLHPFKA